MEGKEITGLTVRGFKSFGKKQHLDIRSLTVMAGANSSGKSSALQPLLLLKQTVDATFDPGPLKIDGPNVTFSWNKQMFNQGQDDEIAPSLEFGLSYTYEEHPYVSEPLRRTLELEFQQSSTGNMVLARESIYGQVTANGQPTDKRLDFREESYEAKTIQNCGWLNSSLDSYILGGKRHREAIHT